MSDRLSTYRDKRDFRKTPEPEGARDPDDDRRIFVIQEHDASTHHFDFRLEVDGALASWAVPKGPSTDPSDKRLAVRTEDHPYDYADFEGVIPEDEYGGGTVIVWDAGSYRNLKEDDEGNEEKSMSECLDEGHLSVWLEGKKLSGGYALTRIDDDEDQWLLVKMDDDGADARRKPTRSEPESVVSGRTIPQVAEEEENDE